jgi:hypothetical protein
MELGDIGPMTADDGLSGGWQSSHDQRLQADASLAINRESHPRQRL